MFGQSQENNATTLAVYTLSITIGLVYLSGIPPTVDLTAFILDLAVLCAFTLATLFAGWWLLMRPLPASYKADVSLTISDTERWGIGLALIVSLTFYTLGIAWDEVWHVKYGIPFGDDFLWRPHQLLYVGLLIIMGIGGYSWWVLMTRGTGTLSQRFRSQPLLGVSALNAILFSYAIPADPLWHEIYGEDLTALSLPHVLVILLAVVGLLAGYGVILPLFKNKTWRPIWKLSIKDTMLILALTSLSIMLTALLTSDWFGVQAEDIVAGDLWIFTRPIYPLGLFLAFVPAWVGTLAIRSTRLIGVATLIGLLAIGIRLSLNLFLGYFQSFPYPWVLGLGILMMIDVLHGWQHQRISWQVQTLCIGVVGVLTIIPFINATFLFPSVTWSNLPSMIVAILVGTGYGIWLGITIGDYFASLRRQPDDTTDTNDKVVLGVLIASIVFLVWFVLTATPPV